MPLGVGGVVGGGGKAIVGNAVGIAGGASGAVVGVSLGGRGGGGGVAVATGVGGVPESQAASGVRTNRAASNKSRFMHTTKSSTAKQNRPGGLLQSREGTRLPT